MAYCNIDNSRVLVCSGYLDIAKPVVQDWLSKVVKYAEDKDSELLIGVDTNCHSNLFGDETNKRGYDLEEFIIENGLAVENTGTIPTFETIRANRRMATCIDATLTRDLGDKISNWKVDQTYNGSDHNTITFEIETSEKRRLKAETGKKGIGEHLLVESEAKNSMNQI